MGFTAAMRCLLLASHVLACLPRQAIGVSSDWRAAVRSTEGAESCGLGTKKTIEALIDSEMLSNVGGDPIAMLALASELQLHRRLANVPEEVSRVLDEKAKGIGKLSNEMFKAQQTQNLLRALR